MLCAISKSHMHNLQISHLNLTLTLTQTLPNPNPNASKIMQCILQIAQIVGIHITYTRCYGRRSVEKK